MKDVGALVQVEQDILTAYHPETNGQVKRINAEVEQYLRLFVNYEKDNWVCWLLLAEFAYNNRKLDVTAYSPFFVVSSCHPHSTWVWPTRIASELEDWLFNMWRVREEIEALLHHSKWEMGRPAPDDSAYKPGVKIIIDGKNTITARPLKKLANKFYVPFEILGQMGVSSYKVKLPIAWTSHGKLNTASSTSISSAPLMNQLLRPKTMPSPRPD